MKNRHLMAALLAAAPVVAIAQVSSTPPVGNASETMTNGATVDPLPNTGTATESTTDVGAGATTGTGSTIGTGTLSPMPGSTTGTTSTSPGTPDPTAPKPRG